MNYFKRRAQILHGRQVFEFQLYRRPIAKAKAYVIQIPVRTQFSIISVDKSN